MPAPLIRKSLRVRTDISTLEAVLAHHETAKVFRLWLADNPATAAEHGPASVDFLLDVAEFCSTATGGGGGGGGGSGSSASQDDEQQSQGDHDLQALAVKLATKYLKDPNAETFLKVLSEAMTHSLINQVCEQQPRGRSEARNVESREEEIKGRSHLADPCV